MMTPDDKDWTWVLERAGPECGFDASRCDPTSVAGLVRANASRLSNAELDEATALDDGDPEQLARDYARLCQSLPRLRVLGGCCGTDLRHVSAIGRDMAHRH